MSNEINPERRRFLATAAMTIAGPQFGMIDLAKSQSNPIKQSTSKSFGAMKEIAAGVLNVGYAGGLGRWSHSNLAPRLAVRHLQLC